MLPSRCPHSPLPLSLHYADYHHQGGHREEEGRQRDDHHQGGHTKKHCPPSDSRHKHYCRVTTVQYSTVLSPATVEGCCVNALPAVYTHESYTVYSYMIVTVLY